MSKIVVVTKFGRTEIDAAVARDKFVPKFFLWLKDNASVYEAFVDCALRGRRRGHKKWGAFAIINILRWETSVSETGTQFKITNTYAPSLAKLAMLQVPELRDFFRVRDPLGWDEPSQAPSPTSGG